MKMIQHYDPEGNGIVFRLTGYLIGEVRELIHQTGMHMRHDPRQMMDGYVEVAVAEKGTATIAKAIELLKSISLKDTKHTIA